MLDHLPERDRPAVKARLRRAWATENHALALDGLGALAAELDRSHPGAASSLREGLEKRSPSPGYRSAAGCARPCSPPTRSSR